MDKKNMWNKNNGSRKWLLETLLIIVVAGITTVVTRQCGDDSADEPNKWENVNHDDSYVSGNTADDVQSELKRGEEAPDVSLNDIDAPEEGVQQVPYEKLEQPGPIDKSPEFILFKSSFIVSYNIRTLCPNYVAWKLTPNRINGDVKRSDNFMEDMVMVDRSRVTTQDYAGSGYDRGHMCPAGDNKHDQKAMEESFLMTNICPQSHNLNAGDWKELEEQCRRWVNDYSELYIVAGPIFDKKEPARIGKRKTVKIAVPDRFFKVVLMMGANPKALGFIYPNSTTNKEMRSYAVSVDEVERITGIDFYPNLPDDIERRVERECKPAAWGI